MDEARELVIVLASFQDQQVKGTPPRRCMSPASPPRPSGPAIDLLCAGGLMGTHLALAGLYFPFLPHSVQTELSPPAGPSGPEED